MKEGININQSLSALGSVIIALAEVRARVRVRIRVRARARFRVSDTWSTRVSLELR